MKLSEIVQKVIELGREVYDYYTEELPKWHPNYPLVSEDEGEPPPPPAEGELRAFLESLSEEKLNKLLLLMDIGRGYIAVDDMARCYRELREAFGSPEHAVSQMMNEASLADSLSDGLEELRKHEVDVDRIPLKRAGLRKR